MKVWIGRTVIVASAFLVPFNQAHHQRRWTTDPTLMKHVWHRQRRWPCQTGAKDCLSQERGVTTLAVSDHKLRTYMPG
ncbi:MAG: hypothetical protein EB020_11630 [Proteobacteria bacterium]|nr:hypothetical protein [Pseudomonadota bacterium]NDE75282.1 hypothetical protein [Pseudomonadota bacterium]